MAPIIAQGARMVLPKVLSSIGVSTIAHEVMDKIKGDDEDDKNNEQHNQNDGVDQQMQTQPQPGMAAMGTPMYGAPAYGAPMATPMATPMAAPGMTTGYGAAVPGQMAQGYGPSGYAQPMTAQPVMTQPSMVTPQQSGSLGPVAGVAGVGAGAAGIYGLSRLREREQENHRQASEMSEQSEDHDKTNEMSILKGGLIGAVGGAISKWKDSKEGDNRVLEAAKGAVIGGGAGSLSAMSLNAIDRDGGGVQAALAGGGAAGLASMLKDGGPGFMKSALSGAGIAGATDMAHDKMADAGMSETAQDAVSHGGLGAALGYGYEGGAKGLGIGGLVGGASGAASGLIDKAVDDKTAQAELPESAGGGAEREDKQASKDEGLEF